MGIYRTWANRIEAGTKTWAQCPISRRDGVKEVLREDTSLRKNGMSPERFKEITGEDY